MRGTWVGGGLLVLGSTGALVIELSFRAHERDARARRAAVAARLEPVLDEDHAWPGLYRTSPGSIEEIAVYPRGSFHEFLLDDPDVDLPAFRERSGTWHREGAFVVLNPNDRTRPRELELGRLDGEYVLLGDFSVWRRVPDAFATSSSR